MCDFTSQHWQTGTKNATLKCLVPVDWIFVSLKNLLETGAGHSWILVQVCSIAYPTTVDGWNPANQLRLVVYPIIYRVLCIPSGAEFLPSTLFLLKHDSKRKEPTFFAKVLNCEQRDSPNWPAWWNLLPLQYPAAKKLEAFHPPKWRFHLEHENYNKQTKNNKQPTTNKQQL